MVLSQMNAGPFEPQVGRQGQRRSDRFADSCGPDGRWPTFAMDVKHRVLRVEGDHRVRVVFGPRPAVLRCELLNIHLSPSDSKSWPRTDTARVAFGSKVSA